MHRGYKRNRKNHEPRFGYSEVRNKDTNRLESAHVWVKK